MIRITTRPPTAKCTLPTYMGFLMSEPKHANCNRLGSVLNITHDSVNRFLLREQYDSADLFAEAMRHLEAVGGTLTTDDSVLDKPYAFKMDLVGHFWSGKHHRAVKGINLITLYYIDVNGRSAPVSYRVYDKAEGKTKNDYFLDMLSDVLAWGLKPAFVTADSWYSGVKNLKAVKNNGMGFQFAIESNRTVSIEKGTWVQVQALDIPTDGLLVWLRDFGQVKLFRTNLKDQVRHYVTYLPKDDDYSSFDRDDFKRLHDQHWEIEQYHRAIKQVCNIERFQVRTHIAIMNHIFAALCCFIQLQKMKVMQLIDNVYQWKRALYADVVAAFTKEFSSSLPHLDTKYCDSVNA